MNTHLLTSTCIHEADGLHTRIHTIPESKQRPSESEQVNKCHEAEFWQWILLLLGRQGLH